MFFQVKLFDLIRSLDDYFYLYPYIFQQSYPIRKKNNNLYIT